MSDSDCDWFDKDDDALTKDLLKTIKSKQEANTESNKATTNILNDYIRETTYKIRRQYEGDKKEDNKLNISVFRKLSDMDPIDIFLSALTTNCDFLTSQISLNDSQERVILYTAALAAICRLELPGFHIYVLRKFVSNDNLYELYRLLVAKLMCKQFQNMWTEAEKMSEFLKNVELLMGQSFKLINRDEKSYFFLKDMLKFLEAANSPAVMNKPIVKQVKENILETLNFNENSKVTIDILPALQDLKECEPLSKAEYIQSKSDQNVQEYLSEQMQLLKQDYILPLRNFITLLENKRKANDLPDNLYVYENVSIVLNEEYTDACRHELIFADVLGIRRDVNTEDLQMLCQLQQQIRKIKCGALLCFTRSYDFDCLILATVTYTSSECLKEGFIGIDIIRQCNIGNIYREQLLMFEAPEFFEPYYNVLKYLRQCTNLPMKEYVLDTGNHHNKIPKYLNENTQYNCYGQLFKPLTEKPPQQTIMGLNNSQMQAFEKALKQEFTVIQGPPGTGKTYLSVQIVKTLIENAQTPLVLITYTNESLDKFLIKLSEYTDKIVRLGNQSREPSIAKYNIREVTGHYHISSKFKKLFYTFDMQYKKKFETLQLKYKEFDGTDTSFSSIVKAQRELSEVNDKLYTVRMMSHYYAVKEKCIIALTTTCAAKTNFLFRFLKSKIVIFEEAAEIPEAHVVACLTPYTQQVIMIGDHQQLQPQIKRKSHMNISLFEKIFTKQKNPIQLNIQYRMHPKIAYLLCNTIYKDLKSDVSVSQYPPIRKMSTNLFFMSHGIAEAHNGNESSLYNSFEIEEIIKLALHLVENALYATEDIAILSPYSKQVNLINQQLEIYPPLNTIKASTVDSFQGLECNIVLLSLVRSNTKAEIGFLKQSNRICVALSRAKLAMYIIGNLQLLSQCSTTWQEIQGKLIEQNALGPKFPIE